QHSRTGSSSKGRLRISAMIWTKHLATMQTERAQHFQSKTKIILTYATILNANMAFIVTLEPLQSDTQHDFTRNAPTSLKIAHSTQDHPGNNSSVAKYLTILALGRAKWPPPVQSTFVAFHCPLKAQHQMRSATNFAGKPIGSNGLCNFKIIMKS
mgnify:CR=1